MPKSRSRKPREKKELPRKQRPPKLKWRRRLIFLVSPWGLLLEIIGLAASLYVFWEVYFHTMPEVRARDSDPTSSFVLPFSVVNKSLIFDINSVTLTCGVELVAFENMEKQKYIVGDVILDTDTKIEKIPRNSPTNYSCDASGVLRVQTDGSLALGILQTPPNAINSKLTVSTMCVWIGMKYKTVGISRTFQSQVWGWYTTPDGHHQWIEGPRAEGISKEYLCKGAIDGPFMHLQKSGLPLFQLKY
jgi:hypothetical protein